MRVCSAIIFVLIVFAVASSQENGGSMQKKYSRHLFGMMVIGFVLKEVPRPTLLMGELIRAAFPDLDRGAADLAPATDKCLLEVNARNVTVCEKYHAIPTECMKSLQEYYEQHVPLPAKEIPKLLTDSYVSSVDYVCNLKTGKFLELTNECVIKAQGTPEHKKLIKEQFSVKSKAFRDNPTKAGLCDIVNALKPHMVAAVKISCASPVTVKAFAELYDASSKPCLQ